MDLTSTVSAHAVVGGTLSRDTAAICSTRLGALVAGVGRQFNDSSLTSIDRGAVAATAAALTAVLHMHNSTKRDAGSVSRAVCWACTAAHVYAGDVRMQATTRTDTIGTGTARMDWTSTAMTGRATTSLAGTDGGELLLLSFCPWESTCRGAWLGACKARTKMPRRAPAQPVGAGY